MSQGAVSLARVSLTDANVSAGVLTIPDGGYFVLTAAAPVTVNQLNAGIIPNRLITIRVTAGSSAVTFADTATLFLNGAFTTGVNGATITFVVERTGGLSYSYEVARTPL